MIHTLKHYILLIIELSFLTNLLGQTTDSVQVSGQVRWNTSALGISGYPEMIKAISRNGHVYTTPIDNEGNYTVRLPQDAYRMMPSKHYYWMDDEYIRLNDSISQISIILPTVKKFTAPILKLDTMAVPDHIPKVGIAHHFTDKKAHLLDAFIKEQMEHYEIPGASLAIIKKGKVIYNQVYGVSNVQTREPVTKKTLFEAGSLTKPVFAFVVLRLVEKGIIALDQTLYEILPYEAVEQDERYKLITVRHVLCHQTGLPNWGYPDETGHFNLLFTPGTSFGYSGEGYEYLKRVIVKLTGKGISQILNEELLAPLDLHGFYFEANDSIKQYSARGHIDLKPSDVHLIHRPMMAYSLFTEAKSFSKYMLALRNKKGLQSDTYQKMFSVQSTRSDGIHWGLGFEIEDTPVGRSIGHSGSTTRFICNFTFFPKLDMGYVFFTNSEMGAQLSIPLLTQYLITGKKPKE